MSDVVAAPHGGPGAPVIGTPWTGCATRVALLGAGEIGKEVAIALTRLGVEVTAIDRYEGAPAQQVAHNALTVDMGDPAALTAAVLSSGADVVVPEIEALATDALVALEAGGRVRVVPTARAVQLTMNREGIRRLAADRPAHRPDAADHPSRGRRPLCPAGAVGRPVRQEEPNPAPFATVPKFFLQNHLRARKLSL